MLDEWIRIGETVGALVETGLQEELSHSLQELEKLPFVLRITPGSCRPDPVLVTRAVALLQKISEADAVQTVCVPDQNPFKMWAIREDGYLSPVLSIEGMPEAYNQPRQQLPRVYERVDLFTLIR